MVWTLVEPGVAIVAASLATIRPLLRALRIRGFDSTGRTGRSGGIRSGTNRSAHNRTLDRDDPKRVAAVELGPLDGEKAGRRPYSNFSRPQRPPAFQASKGAGLAQDQGFVPEERGGTLRVMYAIEDGQSTMSSFDISRGAHSQDSGRVGLGSGGR